MLSGPRRDSHRAACSRPSGGGAALARAFLAHCLSRDIDLFCHDVEEHRALVRDLGNAATEAGETIHVQRDGGSFVRAELVFPDRSLLVDVVHEPVADLELPVAIDSANVESLADLRAAKLTCVLSRAEPTDLVGLLSLDRAGFPPERDLELAVQKDAGIDPGALAWLLRQFRIEPCPSCSSRSACARRTHAARDSRRDPEPRGAPH